VERKNAVYPIGPMEGLSLNLVSGTTFHEKLWYDFKDGIGYPNKTTAIRVVIPFVRYCQTITSKALFF